MKGAWLAALSIATTVATATSGPVTAGRAVAEVLREAQTSGIRVIFTDQSVPPRLRVSAEPSATQPVERLREILRPHALKLEQVTPDVYVVLRGQNAAITVAPDVGADDSRAPLQEVQVTTSRYTLESLAQGSFELRGVEMERQPALFNDATRSIRRFPGTAGQDLSSRTFVRGGTPDDNLILLDGVPLYDPFHLAGLPLNFSAIDPTVISGLDFYSGVLPVEHSGRMGGLVDMRLLDPPARSGGRISVGVLDTSALASGPLPTDRGDWLMFGRRGLLGRMTQIATEPEIGHPELFDVLTRVRYRLDDGATVTLGGLFARDHARIESPNLFIDDRAARRYGWAAYERRGERMESRTTFSYTSIETDRIGVLEGDILESFGSLDDGRRFRSARLQQTWSLPLAAGALHWGGAIRDDKARFDFDRRLRFQEDVAAFFRRPPVAGSDQEIRTSARASELFVGWNQAITGKLTLDAGLAWMRTAYPTDQTDSAVDPRASLRFDVTHATRLRFSYGRMTQQWSAAELPVEQERLRFDDSSRNTMKVLSLEHDFGDRLSVRVEGFNKRISNPRPRLENVFYPTAFLPELRADKLVFEPYASEMRGVDVYATARFSERFSGWLSYSRSQAFDSAEGVRYARAWDQPHSGGIGLAMTGTSWLLSAEVMGHENWPLTPMAVALVPATSTTPMGFLRYVGARSSDRKGFYLTLNLKAARTFQFSSGSLRVALEVSNATDRTNWCCNDLVFYRSMDNGVEETSAGKKWLPMMPYATIAWEFGGVASR